MPLPNKWWHVLATFYFDSRTTRIAKGEVAGPSYTYEARLLSAGYLDRSIPVPSGLFQVSDAVIEIAETDRAIRDFLCLETPLRRLFSLKLMPNAASEAAYEAFGTCEILDAEFEAGKCRITGRDITWSWIDKQLPGLGNRTNFDYLMADVDEFFFPILQGIVESTTVDSPGSFQGQVLLPRMGQTAVGSPAVPVDRWALCQTPIIGPTVYRKLPDEEVFTVVPQGSPAEWAVTSEEHTIDGIQYSLQFLDFLEVQPEGTQIRVDYEGIFYRGPWGSMPEVYNSPLSAIRNPVDFLINILYALLANEPRIVRYNVDSFAAVREALEVAGDASPAVPYYCDGAITEPITAREFLGRFLTSFELDLFVNRYGELTLNFTQDSDPDRPLFSQGPIFGEATDNSLILINSVRERLANPHANRVRYNYARNYATNQWGQKAVRDNAEDQLAMGGTQSPAIPEVVEDILEMWFVRDEPTAREVVRRRMEFLALGSYRIEFNTPLPEVFDDIELARLMGVTSHWGLATGGYHNTEFKTTGLTYNLDTLMCTIRGVLRSPVEIVPGGGDGDAEDDGFFTGSVPLEMVTAPLFDDTFATTYSAVKLVIDSADYPGATGVRFEVVGSTEFAANNKIVDVVDENGNVKASVTIPKGLDYFRIESSSFALLTGEHSYMPKLRADSDSQSLQITEARLWIDLENSSRVKLQIMVLAGGDLSSGGGAGTEALNNYFAYFAQRNWAGGGVPVYGYCSVVDDARTARLLLDKSKFSSIVSFQFEAIHGVLAVPSDHGTSYVRLLDRDTGNPVNGSELTTDSQGVATRTVATIASADLTTLHEFEPQYKFVCPNEPNDCCHSTIYRVALYVTLDTSAPTRKAQFFVKTGYSLASGFNSTREFTKQVRTKLPMDLYPANTIYAVEDTAESTAATPKMILRDCATSDSGKQGFDVTSSDLTFSATRSRQRSGSLTLGTNPNPPTWSAVTAYTLGDVVTRLGNVYRALQASTNKPPESEPTFWAVLTVIFPNDNRFIFRYTGPTTTGERIHHAFGFIMVEIPAVP